MSRVRCAEYHLGRVMPGRQLLDEFERTGIVRVRSAIPAAEIKSMAAEVWDNLERRYPFRRNQPETWTRQRVNGLHALDACVTFEQIGNSKVCQILDELLGAGNWQRPARWGSLLMAFPESRAEWDVPYTSWHLDLPASNAFDALFAVRLFTWLQPLQHGGGATLVVAGSHLLVERLLGRGRQKRLRSAEVRKGLMGSYPWVRALCSSSERAQRIARFMDQNTDMGVAQLRVIEMTGEAGDMLLVHPLLLHAPSTNCADIPRMVLSTFVYRNGVDPERI